MEPIFLICIGAALFSHAWYAMGMYSDGRTTGIIVGALGAGALISLTVDPVLMGAETTGSLRAAEVNVFRALVVFWAIYAGAIAAHGMCDLDDRAIGFFGVPLAAVSITVALFAFTGVPDNYDWTAWLPVAISGLLLGLVGIVLFLNLACVIRALNGVAAWTMLVSSVVLTAIGIAVLTGGIG